MDDLISVIIPAYNAEKYMDRCLNSIVKQSYNNLQIIVVNDGSTDNTKKILEKFAEADNRIVVINQKNGGVSQARNNGIYIAKGKYMCFVDSDDYIDINMIQKLYDGIKKCELSVCGFVNYFDNEEKDGPSPFGNTNGLKTRNEYLKIMSKYLYSVYFGALWNKLYLSEIIMKNNIRFDDKISFAEDFIFNIKYLEYVTKVSIVHNNLYYYYQEVKNSLTKVVDVQYRWQASYTKYCCCIEQYKKMDMYNECYREIYSAIAYELIGPTYDITKENYKGFKTAKESLKKFYEEELIKKAIKNVKKPQMVHRIAKISLFLKSYGIFVFCMRVWIKIQRYDGK